MSEPEIEGLLEIARSMVSDSKTPAALDFDVEEWLARWLELSQAALNGRTPAELLGTPEGLNSVVRVLGAIESGSYQ